MIYGNKCCDKISLECVYIYINMFSVHFPFNQYSVCWYS